MALVLAGHLVLLLVLLGMANHPQLREQVMTLSVRMVESVAPPRPVPPQPSPAPPVAQRKAVTAPPPVLAAAAPAAASSSFSVAPAAPVAQPVQEAAQVVAVPVVAPRFDADYLQNPKPAYPAVSRRMGEEGKVMLRVRVSAQGSPLTVEIKQSSGFVRLDEAARQAVERWRFVPARQGAESVEATVLVPLQFKLD